MVQRGECVLAVLDVESRDNVKCHMGPLGRSAEALRERQIQGLPRRQLCRMGTYLGRIVRLQCRAGDYGERDESAGRSASASGSASERASGRPIVWAMAG
jgi:hypothetical protein